MSFAAAAIVMLRHALHLADEVRRLEALQADADERLMLEAEVTGRPVWEYCDDSTATQLAEAREGWRAMAWGISTPTTDSEA